VQRGDEPGKKKGISVCFNLESNALEALVKVCFDDSMRQLAEKGFVKKCPADWNYEEGVDTNADEIADCYSSKGIDLIPGAQKVVSDIVADAVTKGMNEKGLSVFEKTESKMPDAAAMVFFKSTLQRMIYSSIMNLYSELPLFKWCDCISDAQRITLAINVVNDICKQYSPNKSKGPLRYTSIATGSLLQDYIILEELKVRGFTKMTINLIDPGYFSPAEIENLKKFMPLPKDKKHADHLLAIAREADKLASKVEEAEEIAEKEKLQEVRSKLRTVRDRKFVIEELKRAQEKAGVEGAFGSYSATFEAKMDELSDTSSDSSENEQKSEMSDDHEKFLNTVTLTEFTKRMKEGSGTDIEVIAWENAYDYFERAKKYPDKRSDVFLLIDPDMGYFVQPSYPSLANVIRLMPSGNQQEDVYVINPLHSSAQVWVCNEKVKQSPLYKELAALVSQSKDKGRSLTTALEKRFKKRLKKGAVSREYIVDLYLLAQDMMYEALAVPHKAVVYMGKEETSKIDPLAYQKRDIVGERAREICKWEAEMDGFDIETAEYDSEMAPLLASLNAENAKMDAGEVSYEDYRAKVDEIGAKMDEIKAKYGVKSLETEVQK
jgi:hypothetical protein